MSQVKFPNGNTYDDDGTTAGTMLRGGHRQNLIPMLADAVAVAASTAGDSASAAASRTAAAGSATAAAGSATAAQTARTGAETARTQAGTSATNAGNSATAAAGSATSAGNSASTASTKAGEAAGSAMAAANSATTATNKAAEAGTSATNAANSATAANTAKTAAETARGQAQTHATNAGNSATAAATSASNAAGSATTATNKAAAAVDSAAAAAASESTVTAQATAAATSASNAARSADEASLTALNIVAFKDAAQEAAGSATQARTDAVAARAAAETARTQAGTSATNAANSATAAGTARGAADTSATNAANSAAEAKQYRDEAAQIVTDGIIADDVTGATSTWSSSKLAAELAGTMKTAGVQTISGIKTFTSELIQSTADGTASFTARVAPGRNAQVSLQTDNSMRWAMRSNSNAETGSNEGSNWELLRYSDAGGLLGAAIGVNRASGMVSVPNLAVGTFAGPAHFTSTVAVAPTTGNAAIELGGVAGASSTPFIDFHSGATAVDYDARIIASGGTGTSGQGNIAVTAALFDLSNVGHSRFGALATVQGDSGGSRMFALRTGIANRWGMSVTSATESGGNAGSNFAINRYSDVGGFIDQPFVIYRQSGDVEIPRLRAAAPIFNGGAYIDGPNASSRMLFLRTGTSNRWSIVGTDSSETGSNVGSNLAVNRYADNGQYIDTPFSIRRDTGVTTIGKLSASSPVFSGTPTAPTPALTDNSTQIATTAFVKASAQSAVVFDAASTALNTGNLTQKPSGTHYIINTATMPSVALADPSTLPDGYWFKVSNNQVYALSLTGTHVENMLVSPGTKADIGPFETVVIGKRAGKWEWIERPTSYVAGVPRYGAPMNAATSISASSGWGDGSARSLEVNLHNVTRSAESQLAAKLTIAGTTVAGGYFVDGMRSNAANSTAPTRFASANLSYAVLTPDSWGTAVVYPHIRIVLDLLGTGGFQIRSDFIVKSPTGSPQIASGYTESYNAASTDERITWLEIYPTTGTMSGTYGNIIYRR